MGRSVTPSNSLGNRIICTGMGVSLMQPKSLGPIVLGTILTLGLLIGHTISFTGCALYDPHQSDVPTGSIPGSVDVDEDDNFLDIVTLNTWHGLVTDKGVFRLGEYETSEEREARYQNIVESILELQPDVIALQETNQLPGFASRIAQDLNYDEIHQISNGGLKIFGLGIPTNVREGLVILARKRLKLERVGSLRLSGPFWGFQNDVVSFQLSEMRYALLGKVTVRGTDVYILNVHLHGGHSDADDYSERLSRLRLSDQITQIEYDRRVEHMRRDVRRRKQEISRALYFLDRKTNHESPVIFLGDFNATEDSEEVRTVMTSGRFIDSFREFNPALPGFTVSPSVNLGTGVQGLRTESRRGRLGLFEMEYALKPERVDYVFVRGRPFLSNIQEVRVTFNQVVGGEYYPSDHFGVFVRFLLPG